MDPPAAFAASSPPGPSAVVVKLSLRGETYRVTYSVQELTWRALEAKVNDCYDDAHRPEVWTLVYRDDEDDLVTVSNEVEFHEAVRVFAELKGQPTPTENASGERKLHMHFHVVAKLSLREQLAPVMHVVTEISEKMARLAADTRESLRKSSYVERGRESLYHSAVHTREALSSAGRGLSQRVRRASTVVVEEIPRRLRTRTRSRFSSQDLCEEDAGPQTLMASTVEELESGRDLQSDMNVAELLAQARAEEQEAERNAAVNADSVAVDVEEFEPVVGIVAETEDEEDEEDEEAGHASDADTVSTASEGTHDEWDVVETSSPERPLSPFFQVETDDEVEVSFTRWASQLVTIRDIMPQVDLAQCIDVLDKHNGDLEAALVELTEL